MRPPRIAPAFAGSSGELFAIAGIVGITPASSSPNFAHLTETGLHDAGSTPPSDHPDLLELSTFRRRPVPGDRFAGVIALQTRKQIRVAKPIDFGACFFRSGVVGT